MVRKPKPAWASKPFTSYENFLYLLTELELTIEAGEITWSASSAIIAWHRLDKLAAAMQQLARQLDEKR